MSDTAAMPEPSLFRENVTEAQRTLFLELALRVEAELREAGIHRTLDDAYQGAEVRSGAALRAAMRQLLKDCTRLGPPSPIGYANDETGALILVCGHRSQHRYGLDGTPLN